MDAKFQYGVASGDPTQEAVILWTHLTTQAASEEVKVEVSLDAEFSQVIDTRTTVADTADDHTVKVDLDGLDAGQTYYFRFTAADGSVSDVGRTKTLPEGDVEQVDLAVFSCANFPAGFFNPYAEAATRKDYDALIHLGDYIYEYGEGGYATEQADALGRQPSPSNELVSASDYSLRYKQYHSDDDLQDLRASAPMIAIWDDHETANDSYRDGAENHDPATEGDWATRRDTALEAYYNWMPIREASGPEASLLEGYRSFDFGDLLSLHMLETRLLGRDETRGDLGSALTGKLTGYASDTTMQTLINDLSRFGKLPAGTDLADPATLQALAQNNDLLVQTAVTALMAEAQDPERSLMDDEQLGWLSSEVASSPATWQVLGQQVLMNQMYLPAPLLTDTTGEVVAEYAVLMQKLAQGIELNERETALLNAQKLPYNLDAWDGYAAAREQIGAIMEDSNAIVLAGDTHNAWYSDVNSQQSGETFAKQFATPGVSAPGLESYLADVDPDLVARLYTTFVDGLDYADTSQRGYLDLTFTDDEVSGDWVFVDNIESRDYQASSHTETHALSGVLVGSSADDDLRIEDDTQAVRLDGGANTLRGSLDTLLGTIIQGFDADDSLIIENHLLAREAITVTADGSAILDVDSNGDGSSEGRLIFQGDHAEGDFMAVQAGEDTLLSFHGRLPALVEGQAVADNLINGITNPAFLTAQGPSDFAVNLVDMGYAGFRNALGVYEITADGRMTETRLLFDDAAADKSASALISGVEDGHQLGFFIVQDAASWAAGLGDDDTLAFLTESGDIANLTDGTQGRLAVNGVAVDEEVYHSHDAGLNRDGQVHALSGVAEGGASMLVGFEDLTGLGDRDFEDVVLSIEPLDPMAIA